MSIIETIHVALKEVSQIEEISDGVRVTTHCMYPSNGLVQVVVRGMGDSFVVSDEGGAIDELISSGANVTHSKQALERLAGSHGLNYSNGVLYSPNASRESLPVAILLVANAAKDVSNWLFSHTKIKRKKDFKKIVKEFLNHAFEQNKPHEAQIVGKSNKPHSFENVIVLSAGRRLVVDAVIHDANSINARVVANLDVRGAGYEKLEQRIVYDDEDSWPVGDLELLQLGAIVVPFSRSEAVFRRLAA